MQFEVEFSSPAIQQLSFRFIFTTAHQLTEKEKASGAHNNSLEKNVGWVYLAVLALQFARKKLHFFSLKEAF